MNIIIINIFLIFCLIKFIILTYFFYIALDLICFIFSGVQQYLFENTKTHCIFLELNFEKFTNAFDELIRKYLDQLSTTGNCLPFNNPLFTFLD